MIYLCVFLLLCILRFALSGDSFARRRAYWPTLVSLFLFSAFRFEVGCDWTGYINQYHVNQFQELESLGAREALWWGLIAGLRHLDLPYPWLNVASSAIFFAGVHVLARRQPDPFSFLILLYPVLILNMPMSGIRQGAAIGVICVALVALLDQRLGRFLVWTVIASALHASAAVLLLLAPFVRGHFSTTRLLLAGVLALPGALLLLAGQAEFAASRYIGTGVEAYGAAFRLAALSMSGAFFLLLLRQQWRAQFPSDYKLAILGSLGMAPLIASVAVSTVIGDRLGYYFVPLQAMIFARIPYIKGLPQSALLTAGPYFALLLMLSVWVATSQLFSLCYQPYGTWLFGFPETQRWLF